MDGHGIALAFALTSVPAFLIAASLNRSRARRLRESDPRGAREPGMLARLMNTVGVVLLAGALAMLWAAGDGGRVLVVALAMALLVNGIAVLMLLTVLRARRRGGR